MPSKYLTMYPDGDYSFFDTEQEAVADTADVTASVYKLIGFSEAKTTYTYIKEEQ